MPPGEETSGDVRDIVAKFAHAWRELKTTYNNPRILVSEQLRKLFSLPPVEQESSTGLKSLQRGINGCLSALGVYEISTRDWDPIIVFLCMQRLPNNTITLWEQSIRCREIWIFFFPGESKQWIVYAV